MESALRVCANCRVLVQPCGDGLPSNPFLIWEHVPEFAVKFSRTVCAEPAPGRVPSGSELRFGLARVKSNGGDKLTLKGLVEDLGLPDDAPVTIAVDGSYKLTVDGDKVTKPMSWAYIATSGLYGLGTSIIPGKIVGGRTPPPGAGNQDPVRVLQAELRAMANALQVIEPDRHVTILSDSRSALDMMALWRQGYEVMPGGYDTERAGGRESTLGRLARRVREHPDRITLDWVAGHSGHPLNEGADALAKMARAWATGRIDKETAAEDARRAAVRALERHATGALA